MHAGPVEAPEDDGERRPAALPTPIVAICASAFSLDDLCELSRQLANAAGAAFLVVHRLDEPLEQRLRERLLSESSLPLVGIDGSLVLEPDHLYLLPTGGRGRFLSGRLVLDEPGAPGPRLPADALFSSLAEERGARAIAVLLAGVTREMTAGVQRIKAHGGMVIVQDPSAQAGRSQGGLNIASSDLSYLLPLEEIPELLADHLASLSGGGGGAAQPDQDSLEDILSLLVVRQEHDFRPYRRSTLLRRILRRMQLRRVPSLRQYHALLRESDAELQALTRDFLIGVTCFFRDRAAWQLLADRVLPELLEQLGPEEPLRAWVPGCATGEEAYSIAIALSEAVEARGQSNRVLVFGTDISDEALEIARQGAYTQSQLAELDPQRRARYFWCNADLYQVKKNLREKVIFAPQNLLTDPPFSSLSLISCRNLLIYVDPGYHERILRAFYYGLRSGGCLFLGGAETVGHASTLFTTISSRYRLYRRRDGAMRPGQRLRPRFVEEPRSRGLPPVAAEHRVVQEAVEGVPAASALAATARPVAPAPAVSAHAAEPPPAAAPQVLDTELNAVNADLAGRLRELQQARDDLTNLMAGLGVSILLLDETLCVRRYSPGAGALLNIGAQDLGRSIGDLVWGFDDSSLLADACAVLDGAAPKERPVQDHEGRWYVRRVAPYVTATAGLCGLLLSFRQPDGELLEQISRQEPAASAPAAWLDRFPVLLAYLDSDYRYRFANRHFANWIGRSISEITGRQMAEILGGGTFAQLEPLLDQALSGATMRAERLLEIGEQGESLLALHLIPDADTSGEIRGLFCLMLELG